jgi:hypothetical protein
MQKVLKQLMGPNGFFTKRNSMFDLLQRPRRSVDTKAAIFQIFKAVRTLFIFPFLSLSVLLTEHYPICIIAMFMDE